MKTESLAEEIDKLVRDHLAQVRADAAAALERAFATASTKTVAAEPSGKRAASKRRDPKAVAELAERLHARIVAEPGESMTVHARQLGSNARELHRPTTMLREAGRLRTTGARNNTKYYPTPGS